MLLYVCLECGKWQDQTLAEAFVRAAVQINLAFEQAFGPDLSVKTGVELASPVVAPTCPNGHGALQHVTSDHHLFAWRPEEIAFSPSPTIVPIALPSPSVKHDGSLDKGDPHDDCHGTVEFLKNYGLRDGEHVVEISGGYGDFDNSRILLDPSQALSLLAWLAQEQATLEQMVRDAEKS